MEISSCVSVLLLVPHSTVVSDCRMDWVRELRWNRTMCSEPFLEAKALLKWWSLLRRQFRHTLRHFLFSSPCTCKSSEMKLIKLKIFTPATKHIVQFSCSIVVSFKLSCRAICEVLVGKSRGASDVPRNTFKFHSNGWFTHVLFGLKEAWISWKEMTKKYIFAPNVTIHLSVRTWDLLAFSPTWFRCLSSLHFLHLHPNSLHNHCFPI